jgi:hypothetical protein
MPIVEAGEKPEVLLERPVAVSPASSIRLIKKGDSYDWEITLLVDYQRGNEAAVVAQLSSLNLEMRKHFG